jgi:hypothetical protein
MMRIAAAQFLDHINSIDQGSYDDTLAIPPRMMVVEDNLTIDLGVAYVALIEHEYMHANKLSLCDNCLAPAFDKPLRRCNGCMLVDYCSKEYVRPY